jgi:ankyrin repeat protein
MDLSTYKPSCICGRPGHRCVCGCIVPEAAPEAVLAGRCARTASAPEVLPVLENYAEAPAAAAAPPKPRTRIHYSSRFELQSGELAPIDSEAQLQAALVMEAARLRKGTKWKSPTPDDLDDEELEVRGCPEPRMPQHATRLPIRLASVLCAHLPHLMARTPTGFLGPGPTIYWSPVHRNGPLTLPCSGHVQLVGTFCEIQLTSELVASAAAGTDSRELCRFIRDYELDPSAQCLQTGQTALRAAAAAGHTETVMGLLELGVDLSDVDADGRCALWLACAHGSANVLVLLLDVGVRSAPPLDDTGASCAGVALRRGHEGAIVALFNRATGRDGGAGVGEGGVGVAVARAMLSQISEDDAAEAAMHGHMDLLRALRRYFQGRCAACRHPHHPALVTSQPPDSPLHPLMPTTNPPNRKHMVRRVACALLPMIDPWCHACLRRSSDGWANTWACVDNDEMQASSGKLTASRGRSALARSAVRRNQTAVLRRDFTSPASAHPSFALCLSWAPPPNAFGSPPCRVPQPDTDVLSLPAPSPSVGAPTRLLRL